MEVKIQIPDNCELIKDGDTYIVKEKKNDKPKSWAEFCKNYPITSEEYYIDTDCSIYNCNNCLRKEEEDKNVYTSVEEAEAFLALMQLRQLRKAWVGDWNPSGNNFYAIIFSIGTGLKIADFTFSYRVLSFPTLEMAKEFFHCFRDLCETAKILL